MATFKPVVFKTGKNVKSDGTTNIKIRVYHNKESQYIPTEYYIDSSFMLPDGSINPLHPNADLYNFELGDIIQKYRKAGLELGSERSAKMSCAEYRDYLVQSTQPDYDTIDFVEFCNEHIKNTKKAKTAEWYQQSLDSFVWFYGKSKIDARDITRLKIKAWMDQLKKSGQRGRPLASGSISNYVRGLRALYNECKDKYNNPDFDIIRIPNEPFALDIPVYQKKKRNLPVEVIKKIRDFKTIYDRTAMARDVFMMQFYMMGINIGDLYRLSEPLIGRVNYERSKTNTDSNTNIITLSIKVVPELQLLFDKYSKTGFLSELKKYSNSDSFRSNMNRGLKDIGKEIGVHQISTNWARHSWASIARNKAGISKADIDFCLGHSTPEHRMADIYIEIDYSICDKANSKVVDLLNN
jgi:integrase